MIDTNGLRLLSQQDIGALKETQTILLNAADELDRLYPLEQELITLKKKIKVLYHDHTPLTREQLEEVLKEEGWLFHYFPSGDCELRRGKELGFMSDDLISYQTRHTLSIKDKPPGVEYVSPLPAVTRATLRACGVIA